MFIAKMAGQVVSWALFVAFAAPTPTGSSAQWEKEIRTFEGSDQAAPPPKGAVLFVGSSSIRLWTNLAECFPKLTTIRRGFGGSHLGDAIAFAERIILPYQPAKIVVYAGENDIARGDTPQQVFADFRTLVQKIHHTLPRTPIYFISIKPAPVRWHLSPQEMEANELIRRYCAFHSRVTFIDVWPALLAPNGRPDPSFFIRDNLHLSAKGYKVWTQIIGKALQD